MAEKEYIVKRVIDIDPKYVSAMIERWESYTEKKSIKLNEAYQTLKKDLNKEE